MFLELEQQHVGYAIWKNAQELPQALAGDGDIDLYIYPDSHQSFQAVLQSLGFVRLVSHKSYPCVEHYFGLDIHTGRFAHLHCYYRLVTGESHIKQYTIPIEPYLSDYPAILDAEGYRIMHPVLQKKLNIFRRKIKLSCLPGAWLFFRERHGYQQEKELTSEAEQNAMTAGNAVHASGWLADIAESPTTMSDLLDGFRYRWRYQHWNRFPPLTTPCFRYRAIVLRAVGKLRQQRKTLPVGLNVSVSTVDIAHADKLETAIGNWMEKHFSIRFMTTRGTRRISAQLLDLIGRTQAIHADTDREHPDDPFSLLGKLAWYSWRWSRQVRQSVYWSMSGFIVIWDAADLEHVSKASQVVSSMNVAHPGLKSCLLQTSRSCLGIEPAIGFRLDENADADQLVTNPGSAENLKRMKQALWEHVSQTQC
ncbi:MAG: hypothetical protein HKN42_17200 [Granulosicoccus sp.]|nr:hypothetical protein [Granulosicoccus sp.]